MGLKIIPKTINMSGEERQLEEMIEQAIAAEKGSVLLFPEYGAYTVEGSQKAYKKLADLAVTQDVSIITSLNLGDKDLPYSNLEDNYNLVFIFSRFGEIYAPQAKIAPQSFEMGHLSEKAPVINVKAYDYLNKIILDQNGQKYSGFILNCSDISVMWQFDYRTLKSDAVLCLGDFANGAQDVAAGVIDYAVKSGLFKQGFFSNIGSKVREGKVPFTIGREIYFDYGCKKIMPYRQKEMRKLIDKSSAIYPDKDFKTFSDMLKLTLNGTFTIPESRSPKNLEGKIKLGAYERIIYV